jgi:hypothetical protein
VVGVRAVDRAPARLSRRASIGAGLVALASSGLYSWGGLAAGGLGLLLLLTGLVRGTTAAVTVGGFGLFVGAVLAGARGAPILPVLVGVTCAVLAWDAGGSAVSVGRQLGREADTARLEAVHLAASAVVGAVVAGVGFGLYRVGTDGGPVAAVALLVIAAVLLVAALD